MAAGCVSRGPGDNQTSGGAILPTRLDIGNAGKEESGNSLRRRTRTQHKTQLWCGSPTFSQEKGGIYEQEFLHGGAGEIFQSQRMGGKPQRGISITEPRYCPGQAEDWAKIPPKSNMIKDLNHKPPFLQNHLTMGTPLAFSVRGCFISRSCKNKSPQDVIQARTKGRRNNFSLYQRVELLRRDLPRALE